jgi:hypothetical protein
VEVPEDPQALVSLLRSGTAPADLKIFAARGVLPLDSENRMRGLLAVTHDPDPLISGTADKTLRAVPPEDLSQFLAESDPTGVELDTISQASDDPIVLEQIIRHRNADDVTLGKLARTVTGTAQEALVVNQVRLLRTPSLIDALFENPHLTADARRRLNEVREEFFDKELRRKETAQRDAVERAEFEAEAARVKEAAQLAGPAAAAPAEEISEEGLDEEARASAIFRRIQIMTVAEKINLAYGGGKEERRILIQDANKLVGLAVLKSRGLTVHEVESYCLMRHLDDELFRKIALNKEWMRRPAIVSALVKNPSVPIALTLPLVKTLPLRDLRTVTKDPNLPEGVRGTARRLLEDKRR